MEDSECSGGSCDKDDGEKERALTILWVRNAVPELVFRREGCLDMSMRSVGGAKPIVRPAEHVLS